MLALKPGEAQEIFSNPVSDWYWVLTAVLSFILGMIYVWKGPSGEGPAPLMRYFSFLHPRGVYWCPGR